MYTSDTAAAVSIPMNSPRPIRYVAALAGLSLACSALHADVVEIRTMTAKVQVDANVLDRESGVEHSGSNADTGLSFADLPLSQTTSASNWGAVATADADVVGILDSNMFWITARGGATANGSGELTSSDSIGSGQFTVEFTVATPTYARIEVVTASSGQCDDGWDYDGSSSAALYDGSEIVANMNEPSVEVLLQPGRVYVLEGLATGNIGASHGAWCNSNGECSVTIEKICAIAGEFVLGTNDFDLEEDGDVLEWNQEIRALCPTAPYRIDNIQYYHFTPEVTASYVITTFNPAQFRRARYWKLAVFGSSCPDLENFICADNLSTINAGFSDSVVPMEAGETYTIAVGSTDSQPAVDGRLMISEYEPPLFEFVAADAHQGFDIAAKFCGGDEGGLPPQDPQEQQRVEADSVEEFLSWTRGFGNDNNDNPIFGSVSTFFSAAEAYSRLSSIRAHNGFELDSQISSAKCANGDDDCVTSDASADGYLKLSFIAHQACRMNVNFFLFAEHEGASSSLFLEGPDGISLLDAAVDGAHPNQHGQAVLEVDEDFAIQPGLYTIEYEGAAVVPLENNFACGSDGNFAEVSRQDDHPWSFMEMLLAFSELDEPADLSGDGVVDGTDLAILLGSWGPADQGDLADINGDGAVNGADLAIILGSWGST